MNKKVLKRLIIGIVVILLLAYILITIYKYTILKSIQTAIVELNKNNTNYKLDQGNGLVLYYKDGIQKYVKDDDKDVWLWTDGEKAYSHMNGEVEEYTEEFDHYPYYYRMKYEETKTEDLNILKLALNPFNKVSTVKIKDNSDKEYKYIKVQYGNEEIVYFDSETKKPQTRFIGGIVVTESSNAMFDRLDLNYVTDEDVSISEYMK